MARADMESASPKRQSLQAEDKIIAVKELCAMRGVDDATKRWQALNPAIERSSPLSGNWAFVNDSAKRLANLCGMTAPLLWGLVIAYSASLQHEYSHYSQFVSELGERGSSTESIVRYAGFIVTGAMHVAYSIFLYATFRTQRLAVFAATLIGLNGLAHACAGVFSWIRVVRRLILPPARRCIAYSPPSAISPSPGQRLFGGWCSGDIRACET
jgi:Protein of unknown function (DUF998)